MPYVHIGSFTTAGGAGLTTAAVREDTGGLTVTARTDAVANPSYLAVAKDHRTLYAVGELPAGVVAAFSLADPAAPRLTGAPVPAGGADPTHLCVAAGRLHTANYGSGSVGSLALDGPLGAPGTLLGVLRHTGSGPDPDRQEGPHAHAVHPAPGGWLLTTDLGTDTVRVCSTGPDGAARVHRELRVRPGSGPRHLAFHPDGRHVYCVNELDSTLTLLTWDAGTGGLTAGATVPTAPAAGPGGVRNHPSEAVVSADGRFVWVANRGHDSIAVLDLRADRVPVPRTTVPCGGSWPRDLALDPVTGRLYAANERSGDVTWFDVGRDGTPHRAGSLPVPAASCVTFAR